MAQRLLAKAAAIGGVHGMHCTAGDGGRGDGGKGDSTGPASAAACDSLLPLALPLANVVLLARASPPAVPDW